MKKIKPWLLGCFMRCLPLHAYRYKKRRFQASSVPRERKGTTSFTLGILSEFSQYHHHYVRACQELDVSYRIIDFAGHRWLENVRDSGCEAFLVWPSAFTMTLRHMFDERLKILVDEQKKIIFPSYDELWLWESKRRMRDWLAAHEIPHPKTWVFYDLEEAEEFIRGADFPLLYKPDFGDCSQGIRLLRHEREALRQIRKAFASGIALPRSFPAERQWGNAVLQEFVPEAEEWRTAKIGDSFFAYVKLRKGNFASGSGLFRHGRPPVELLDFTERICAVGSFNSMSVDVFRMPSGQFLVNELQAVFGTSHASELCMIDGQPGRMVRRAGEWIFEKGSFCRNQMCNLRVSALLQYLQQRK
jgi:hypothetical protein